MTQRKVDALANDSMATPPSDVDPPFLVNLNPLPGAVDVTLTANILFRIDDLLSPVNLASVLIFVNKGIGFELAYSGSGGGFQAGWNGPSSSVVAAPPNGYDFVIDCTTQFDNFFTVQVHVIASDSSALVNTLDTTYSFQAIDAVPPFLSNHNPLPGAVNVPEASNIAFRVEDGGEGIDLSTLNVSIKQGPLGPFVPAIVNGVFVAPFDGPGSSITAIGGIPGIDYDVVIDPVSDLITDDLVDVRVQVDDLATVPNSLDTIYEFATGLVTPANVDVPAVSKDGGYTVMISGGGIPDGVYLVHCGPLDSPEDPLCYSGIEGQGSLITFSGGEATVVVPPLPSGGPYAFYMEKVTGTGPAVVQTPHVLVVLPPFFRSGINGIRRLLPPWMKLGQRTVAGAPFPL